MHHEGHSVAASQACVLVALLLVIASCEVVTRLLNYVAGVLQ